MKREIKFRRAHFIDENKRKFSHFTEWGINIGFASFTCPSTNNFALYHTDFQYTCLKDKNGKEIYEGDIVKWVNGKHYWEAIISTLKDSKSNTLYAIETFHNCTSDDFDEIYTYERSNSRMGFRNDVEFLSKKIEVIGNIYENPELLEK